MSNSLKNIMFRDSGNVLLPVLAILFGFAALTPVNPIFLKAIQVTGTSVDFISVYAFHLINVLFIIFLVRRDKDLASDRRNIWLFILLYFTAQFFMLINYYGYALQAVPVMFARPAYGTINPTITIDPNLYYIMDGRIDEWIYVLFTNGIFSYPHSSIAVNEKGPLFIYLFLCLFFGSFNMYYPLVFNGLITTLSGFLIFKIGRKCSLNINAALLSAAIFILLPETLLWGGFLQKENLVIFLILSTLLTNLKIIIEKTYKYYLFLFMIFLTINSTRSSILLILLSLSMVSPYLVYCSTTTRLSHILGCLTIIGFILLLVPVISYFMEPVIFHKVYTGRNAQILSDQLVGNLGKVIGKPMKRLSGDYSKVDIQNAEYTENSIVYKLGGKLSLKNLYFVPLRMVMFYLLPWPFWSIENYNQTLILVGSLTLIFLSVFLLFGIISYIKHGGLGSRSLVLYLLLFNLAIVFSGPWIYERYRLMCVPFIILLGLKIWYDTSFKYRVYGGAMALGFYSSANLLYLLIK